MVFYDTTIYIVFILLGVAGGLLNITQFFNVRYRIERWYILFKGLAGFYVAAVYTLIWSPHHLNDYWTTRQCVRGVVLVACGMWLLDALVRRHREGCLK